MDWNQILEETSTSDCTTTPFRSPMGGNDFRNVDNGYLKGGLAVSRVPGTYTGARIACVLNAIPVGVNPFVDYRLCVWDYADHELRAVTGNMAAQMNAVPRGTALTEGEHEGGVIIQADFLEPITLGEGEWVIVGDATYGDYPLRNLGLVSEKAKKAVMVLPPQLGFVSQPTVYATNTTRPIGGYEGGTPGAIGNDASGNYPWMDLL